MKNGNPCLLPHFSKSQNYFLFFLIKRSEVIVTMIMLFKSLNLTIHKSPHSVHYQPDMRKRSWTSWSIIKLIGGFLSLTPSLRQPIARSRQCSTKLNRKWRSGQLHNVRYFLRHVRPSHVTNASSSFQILSYDSINMVKMLDDKIAFLEECQSMGLAVPEFHQISSVEHVAKLRSEGENPL